MAPHVETFFLAVEAEGIRFTALRCAGVLVAFLAGIRARAFIVRSVGEALRQLGAMSQESTQDTLNVLRREGLLPSA
jgi:hypothetical protein